jgi:hypothetical protein
MGALSGNKVQVILPAVVSMIAVGGPVGACVAACVTGWCTGGFAAGAGCMLDCPHTEISAANSKTNTEKLFRMNAPLHLAVIHQPQTCISNLPATLHCTTALPINGPELGPASRG